MLRTCCELWYVLSEKWFLISAALDLVNPGLKHCPFYFHLREWCRNEKAGERRKNSPDIRAWRLYLYLRVFAHGAHNGACTMCSCFAHNTFLIVLKLGYVKWRLWHWGKLIYWALYLNGIKLYEQQWLPFDHFAVLETFINFKNIV